MFGFTETHVIEFRPGVWGYAGLVPLHPRTVRFMRIDAGTPEARAAMMGGRVATWRGQRYAWRTRAFRNREAAERALRHALRAAAQ
jgi:hypothetical protein